MPASPRVPSATWRRACISLVIIASFITIYTVYYVLKDANEHHSLSLMCNASCMFVSYITGSLACHCSGQVKTLFIPQFSHSGVLSGGNMQALNAAHLYSDFATQCTAGAVVAF